MSNQVVQILPKYKPLFENKDKRFILLKGGSGSGKSYVAAQRIVIRCATEPGHRYLVTRKVAKDLRYSVVPGIIKVATAMGIPFKVRKAPHEIIFPESGSMVIFSGLSASDSLQSIEGISSIWLEEAAHYRLEDILELDRRTRGTSHVTDIMFTFNPVSKKSYLYEQFYTGPFRDDSLFISTTYKDNPLGNPSVGKAVERLKDISPDQYKVYALGEWGQLSGNIYGNINLFDTWPPGTPSRIIFGLDYGYHNATALVEVRIYDGQYYVDTAIYGGELHHHECVSLVKECVPDRATPVYVDPAVPGLIDLLSKSGINAKKAKNDVLTGINFVKSKTPVLHIKASASHLIDEWDAYCWEEDKHGNPLEKPVKFKDHALDALRYALFSDEKMVVSRYFGSV